MATKIQLQEQIIDKLLQFMIQNSAVLSNNTNGFIVNPNNFINIVDPNTGQVVTGPFTNQTQLIYPL